MAKAKKLSVKVLNAFYDKENKTRRNPNDVFEVAEKRLAAIQKFEQNNKLKLIEIQKNDTKENVE